MDKARKQFRGEELSFAFDVDPKLGGEEWDIVAEWCIKNTAPGDVFIDVGANIGFMSSLVGRFAQPSLIIAVDPDEKVLSYLEENLKSLSEAEYKIVNELVMNEPGLYDLYFNLDNPAQNSIFKREGFPNIEKEPVIATTIDALVEEFDITAPIVLKIDAEFAETFIWEGMKQSMPLIKAIVMEFHRPTMEKLNINWSKMTEEMMEKFNVSDLNSNNLVAYKK